MITQKRLRWLLENLNMKRAEAGKSAPIVLERHQPGDSRHIYRLYMSGEHGTLHGLWGLGERMNAGEINKVLTAMIAVYNDDDMIR